MSHRETDDGNKIANDTAAVEIGDAVDNMIRGNIFFCFLYIFTLCWLFVSRKMGKQIELLLSLQKCHTIGVILFVH